MSKVLVTGGAGFIGSNLVSRLIDDGHNVVIIDDLSSGHRNLVHPNAEFVEGSILDECALSSAFCLKPDFVIHMAALFANQNSVDHPEKDLLVNGLGTLKILEQSKLNNIKKLLYVSSSCVYGSREIMNEADETYYPDTPYAISKLLGERYCHFWSSQHKINVVTVRLFNTYGPGEYPGKYRNVIPNFIGLALENKPLVITGTGDETRDFTYVTDTVEGISAALFNQTQSGDVFNLATGQKTRIIDIANIINERIGNKAGILFEERRAWDIVVDRQASVEKAKNYLGFAAKHRVLSGLHETCDWLRLNYANNNKMQ
jgi:nucleoside-diphosphate-sugar epimerase